MNKPISSTEENFPKSREQLLNDLDLIDYTEDSDEDFNNSDQTLDDADLDFLDKQINDIEEQEKDRDLNNDPDFAYLPCAAHNIQLVVKDGLHLDDNYTKLIKKVAWIVGKSKNCTGVAEELRRLNKFVAKCVVTRWNSILFMIRSVLKITPEEWTLVRGRLNRKTYKAEQKYKKFLITEQERSVLVELQSVLNMFELITDEFQSNRISISRVYPCIDSLRDQLKGNMEDAIYTKQLRLDLLDSLEKRFGGNYAYIYLNFIDYF